MVLGGRPLKKRAGTGRGFISQTPRGLQPGFGCGQVWPNMRDARRFENAGDVNYLNRGMYVKAFDNVKEAQDWLRLDQSETT